MAYQEPKKRTIRLDDDVYTAVRALPESLNKYLRKVLIDQGSTLTRTAALISQLKARESGKEVKRANVELTAASRGPRQKGDRAR